MIILNVHEYSNALFNIIPYQHVLEGLNMWYMLETNSKKNWNYTLPSNISPS